MNIFVAGHLGMVGSAIVKALSLNKKNRIITAPRADLNLLDQHVVKHFFENNEIDQVYLAAAKVGGILANNEYPASFIYENLTIQSNIIHSAHLTGVQHLLFLGSSCIYPKFAEQPIPESCLLEGILEPTNEPYAIAKIAGIKMCESYNRQFGRSYRSVMPTNLYGPNDNFHPANSHVIPAMIGRFHDAVKHNKREVVVWGSGTPMREFLHADDLALACIYVMALDDVIYRSHTTPTLSHINVGTGAECSIRELAELIASVTGFCGDLIFDTSKPDGTPRKLLNSSKLSALGWNANIPLREGIEGVYLDYTRRRSKDIRGL
jgi:GDP-L-fucose synthase